MIKVTTLLLEQKFYGMLDTNKARRRDCNSFPGCWLPVSSLPSHKARLRDKETFSLLWFFATYRDMTTIRAKLGHLTECDGLIDP